MISNIANIPKKYSKINMYEAFVSFEGIRLQVDPIDLKLHNNDNVMGIYFEEQPLTWLMYKDLISKSHGKIKGEVDFVDIGCGSGFWSILFGHHFGGKVIGIDINARAIKYSNMNASSNNVEIETILAPYSKKLLKKESCKVMYLNPPFNIYPLKIKNLLPTYSRGGSDGQKLFKEQLKIAQYHLAENGMIIFIMMCLGRNGTPLYVEYIPKIFKSKISIKYTNIFQPIKTVEFLKKVYRYKKYDEFINNISTKYPDLFYTNGVIYNDNRGRIEVKQYCGELHGRSWLDRIQLHKLIANQNRS